MTYHKYVVTAQKPTATQFAVKGSFTSATEKNLVLGWIYICIYSTHSLSALIAHFLSLFYRKGTRIEIYTLRPDGLKSVLEFSIYGTIISLQLYTPPVKEKNKNNNKITRHLQYIKKKN
jgi:DNA damage-binding protein 1